MNQILTAAALPVVITFISEGIEIYYRTKRSFKNKKIIDLFRYEIRKFPIEKTNLGVAVPCYRNPEYLAACLANLINNVGILPEDIAVVDDYSNDNYKTINAAVKFKVNTSKLTKYEKDIRKLRAQKRATEILCEKGKKYIVVLDSDSFIRVKRQYLDYCIKEMEIVGLDIFAGRIIPLLNKQSALIEKIQFGEYLSLMRAGRGSMYRLNSNHNEIKSIEDLKEKYTLEKADILCVSGAFGIFKSELLLEILNECKTLCGGEDDEITLGALAEKAKIGYDDNLLIETIVPSTIKEFTKQRIFWANFSSSHYIDAPYFKEIYKRDRKGISLETAETSLMIRTIRNVFSHPIKLISLVFLLINPITLLSFLGSYELLNLFNITILRNKGERKYWFADLLLPVLSMYEFILPITIGYFKQLYLGIRKNVRTRIKKIKELEKDLYLEFHDFEIEKIQNSRLNQKEYLITKVNKGLSNLKDLSKLKNIHYQEFGNLKEKLEKAKNLLLD